MPDKHLAVPLIYPMMQCSKKLTCTMGYVDLTMHLWYSNTSAGYKSFEHVPNSNSNDHSRSPSIESMPVVDNNSCQHSYHQILATSSPFRILILSLLWLLIPTRYHLSCSSSCFFELLLTWQSITPPIQLTWQDLPTNQLHN